MIEPESMGAQPMPCRGSQSKKNRFLRAERPFRRKIHGRQLLQEVVGERELAGAMCIAAFDQAGTGKPGAKLGSVEFLLGCERLYAAAAILAEDDRTGTVSAGSPPAAYAQSSGTAEA